MKLSYLLILTATAWVAAQTAPTTEAPEPRRAAGSYSLSISSRPEYRLGETIIVTALLKNISDREAYFNRSLPVLFYDVDIRLPVPKGSLWKPRATLSEFGQEQTHPREVSGIGFYVPAGHEIVDALDVSNLYQMSLPGDYHVVLSCRLPIAKRGDPYVVVTSNVIVITVLPKEETPH